MSKDCTGNQIEITKMDTEYKISILIVIHIYLMLCKNIMAATNAVVLANNSTINKVVIVLLATLYVILFLSSSAIYRINYKACIFLVSMLFFWIVTAFVDFERFSIGNACMEAQIRTFIAYCFPLFILTSMLNSYDILMELLYKYAIIPFVFSILGFCSYLFLSEVRDYSMSYGYSVLFICILYVFNYYRTRRVMSLFLASILGVFILLVGSRGPIIGIAAAILFCVICYEKDKRKYLICVLLIFCIVMYFTFRNVFADSVLNYLSAKGIQSRTISMLLDGTITSDSGRGEIYAELLNCINKSPFWGLGAYAGEKYVGYSHNIYLDFFANFGYFLGSAFLVVIIVTAIRRCLKMKGSAESQLILFMFVQVFPGGFIGFELWGCKELWILMGVLLGNSTISGRTIRENV